jgi:hypothetical protein
MRDKVLKLNSLLKIRVQDIMNNDGWEKKDFFQLKPVIINNEQIFIELLRDNICLGRWKVVEKNITQASMIHLSDGGIKRRLPMMVFYVVGGDGKKYRYLYFRTLPNQQFLVATRYDHKARYASNCRSRNQRNSPEAIAIRLRRDKRHERKIRKQFAQQWGNL